MTSLFLLAAEEAVVEAVAETASLMDYANAAWDIAPVRALIWAHICAIAIITPMALFAIWAERRFSGLIQSRIGPNRVGPQGLLQTLSDGVKLLGKEHLIPTDADKPLFILAPIIVFMAAFGMYAALPLAPGWMPSNLAVGLLFVMAIDSVEAIGVIMAGWASNNKWALLGTMRVAAQVVSYEVPLALAALVPVVCAGSLNLQELTELQQGGIWNLGLFWAFPANIVAFVVFYIAMLANLKRAPFDLPEAESELVAGFHTEYSGMAFSLFFLAEYAGMFILSVVAAALWLGGWGIPWVPISEGAREPGMTGVMWNALGAAVISFKAMLLIGVMMWHRWTLPRLRSDQVMSLCWKYLLPVILGCLIWAAAWVALGLPTPSLPGGGQ